MAAVLKTVGRKPRGFESLPLRQRMPDVVARRLRAQRLVGPPFESAVDAVRAFGAVQSQDFPGAMWAVGRRTRDVTASQLGRLYDDGAILRTHILRPTWHFVLPEDIGWLLQLTAARLRDRTAGRRRQLGLDEKTIARAQRAFADSVSGGQWRTRPELGEALIAAGIDPAGQRLPHLIGAAELDGVLVSGPRRGKQLTHALLSERVPKGTLKVDRDVARGELARRFFTSHGPAELADFVWWSGLTTADARAGAASVGGALARESVGGRDVWLDPALDSGPLKPGRPMAHLLPNFDEYTVAYRDRAAIVDPTLSFDPSIFSFGSVL
jgi:DNA glycosylase AlkZ-like